METDNIYSLEWTNRVKPLGRVFVYNDCLWMSFSGTGIEFECCGGFKAMLVSDKIPEEEKNDFARYQVYRDGILILDERMNSVSNSIGIKADGVHTFRFVKVSESNSSSLGMYGLEALADMPEGDANMRPTAEKRQRIEIIGDSITCGYGVEGAVGEVFTTATENVTGAWSYLTAQKLDMDYSIVSKSGAGIISGYTADGVRDTENIIVGYYTGMGCSQFDIYEGVKPQDFEYDFSFEPDVVVVLLGTNDISFCHPVDAEGNSVISAEEETARRREFYTEYKKFVASVRARNPFAKIVCSLGVMGTELNGEVKTAADELRAAGDSRIFYLDLTRQEDADGLGTDYHPSPVTQKKLAEKMSGFIREIL